MNKYSITPWRTQADLLEVRQQLYSHHEDRQYEPRTDNRRHAVDRVMAWKLRGNLPHAVESTALLVDAILHQSITTNSTFSIRAVYSAAFCRFVTGFCDIGRHKERNLEPSSMVEIAKQIGMPTVFVALRHEATHEELPGLLRLVTATQQALDWLWNAYWTRLEEPERPEIVSAGLAAFREEAATIMREFRRSRRDALRNMTQSSSDQFGEVAHTCEALVDICNDSHERVKALAEVVVTERMLLPASRELGSSLDGAYLIWEGILKDISLRLHGFLRVLGIAILQSVSQPVVVDPQSDVEKEALAAWVLRLVNLDSGDRGEHECFVADVMKWCCLHPGYWTQRVGSQLLSGGSREFQADWQELLNASSMKAETSDADGGVARQVHRVGDVPAAIQNSQSKSRSFEAREEDRVEGWTKAIMSPAWPIGVA